MAFLKRLFGKSEEPRVRVRVCVECGMPVAEHKTWCSIFRGELEVPSPAPRPRQAGANGRERRPDAGSLS